MANADYASSIPLSEIISRFPGHLFWKDKYGVYLGCNLEQALSFGFKSVDEVIGKSDFDIFPLGEARRLWAVDQHVMKAVVPYSIEETATMHGEEKTFISKKTPLRNLNGDIIGVIGTCLDITEQKRTEIALRDAMQKAQQANVAKNEFIANMSHDLRTPLSGIQALAESMRMTTQDPQLIENTGLLLDASRDLLQLVDSILDVIRVDANVNTRLDREFKLKSLVMNSVNIVQPKIQEKNIHFTLQYDDAVPAVVIGQPLMLQRVLMNLLSNALKFTPDGGEVGLSITVESNPTSNCMLVMEVKDTGIGIPEDKLGVIFDKFSRVSASFKGQYEGTGVGLYMVKQYIEQMHGTVTVESCEHQGTTFTCRIPVTVSKNNIAEQAVVDDSMETAVYKQYPNVVILLVEDSPIAQQSQSAKFKSLGCSVQIAATAHEAWILFQNNQFDLLVVDLGLPDSDGWSLVRRFRDERSNPNSLVPIIILTAHAQEDAILSQNKDNAIPVIFKRKPLMLADAAELLQNCIV